MAADAEPSDSSDYDSEPEFTLELEDQGADESDRTEDDASASFDAGSASVHPRILRNARPPVPESVRSGKHAFHFQNVDASYSVEQLDPRRCKPAHPGQEVQAVVTIYGLWGEGRDKAKGRGAGGDHDVAVHVWGFNPYMYVRVRQDSSLWQLAHDEARWAAEGERMLEAVRALFDERVRAGGRCKGTQVLRVALEWRMSVLGREEVRTPFLRVVLADPGKLAGLRDLLDPPPPRRQPDQPQAPAPPPMQPWCDGSFESNVPFVTRFMVDNGMAGAGWSSILGGSYHVRPNRTASERGRLASHCQLELDVNTADLKHHFADEWGHMAAWRALYFDIEVAPAKPGMFPKADRDGDRVISISCRLKDIAGDGLYDEFVLALGESAQLASQAERRRKGEPYVPVLKARDERDLLLQFALLLRVFSPSVILGYNSINFDMAFLYRRAEHLGVLARPHRGFLFSEMSLRRGRRCALKKERFESGALGKMDYDMVQLPGRLQYDVMLLARRDVTLRPHGYSLKQISEHLKLHGKDDMTYEAIPALYHGLWPDDMPRNVVTPEWRTMLALMDPVEPGQAEHPAAPGDPKAGVRWWACKPEATAVEAGLRKEFDPACRAFLRGAGCYEDEIPAEVLGETWALVLRYNRPRRATPEELRAVAAENAKRVRSARATAASEAQQTEEGARPAKRAKTAEPSKDTQLPPHLWFWEWTREGRALIHDYCRQDSVATDDIERQRMYFSNYVEMARLCFIPPMKLITQGQQIRIISALLEDLRRSERTRDFLVPFYRPPELTADEKRSRKKAFQGATVLNPFVRWIVSEEDGMIPVLDFAGLYPSIMMDWNLCYSTWVRPEAVSEYRERGVAMHYVPYTGHYWLLDDLGNRVAGSEGVVEEDDPEAEAAPFLDEDGPTARARKKRAKAWAQKRDALPAGALTDTFPGCPLPVGPKEARDWADRHGEARTEHVFGSGHYFVDREVFEGVLPAILRRLTAARSAAKKGNGAHLQIAREWKVHRRIHEAAAKGEQVEGQLLADVRDVWRGRRELAKADDAAVDAVWRAEVDRFAANWPETERLMGEIARLVKEESTRAGAFDSKQLAIKVVANSVYGFTGAEVGRLPLLALSSSVTAYGRDMIFQVKRMCEARNPDTGLYCCDETADLTRKEKGLEARLARHADGSEPLPEDEAADMAAQLAKARARVQRYRDGLSKWPVRVAYGDTDSVFPWFVGCTDLQTSWDLGEAVGDMCTGYFQSRAGGTYIKLELEKVVALLNMMGKKRYCTLQWEKNRAGEWVCRVNTKGFELVRRDFCPVVRRVLQRAVALVMPHGKDAGKPIDVGSAVQGVQDTLRDMLRDRLPLEDYVITKSINRDPDDYANGRLPAHMQLRARMEARTGKPIDKGQRLRHAYIHHPAGLQELPDKCEDPEEIQRQGWSIDAGFYIDRQLRKPLGRFFANILHRRGRQALPPPTDDPAWLKEALLPDDPAARARDLDWQARAGAAADELLSEPAERDARVAAVERVLFQGEHMNHAVRRMPKQSHFSSFRLSSRLEAALERSGLGLADVCPDPGFETWYRGGTVKPEEERRYTQLAQAFVDRTSLVPGPFEQQPLPAPPAKRPEVQKRASGKRKRKPELSRVDLDATLERERVRPAKEVQSGRQMRLDQMFRK